MDWNRELTRFSFKKSTKTSAGLIREYTVVDYFLEFSSCIRERFTF